MDAPRIIRKKRERERLSPDEIAFMVGGYSSGDIPDYQMSAFLMACFLNGLDREETSHLTDVMTHSGETYDFSDIEGIKADKHSTGGVGDKVSIPLAPILAELGFYVPMVSGRGLGHTGGTLDKLESIKGFNVNLSGGEFKRMLRENRVVMGGQTESFVPADKKMYALRDVTATVESIPLITASIMSKKLAEGIDTLFLDVKTGSGAFMKEYDDAKKLADNMFEIGEMMGKRMAYVISDMSQCLGDYAGNGCEILESIEIMKGENENRASQLVMETACLMMKRNNFFSSDGERRAAYRKVIESGKAYERFLRMVSLQRGDVSSLKRENLLHEKLVEIVSHESGYVSGFDAYKTGVALIYMNAGRFTKESSIDHRAGIRVLKRTGERIDRGEPVYEVFAKDLNCEAERLLKESFSVSPSAAEEVKLIMTIRGV